MPRKSSTRLFELENIVKKPESLHDLTIFKVARHRTGGEGLDSLVKTNFKYEKGELKKVTCQCKPAILCVDDNEFNLMALSMLIKQAFPDLEVHEVANGFEAVSKFQENFSKKCNCGERYKLIFMDLEMPEMNGFDATEKIIKILRSSNKTNSCKVVALTSFTDQKTRERCKSIGFVDFQNKPI